ncbi:restriction endonuclease subunit S domain-containing protein [Pareuzebyella sediminis]|uniref:hypothetical protein n=1 Tax=Pareuzebyella sediminis TaxID=2607998 RepID=UPI0011EF8645|nr:hypothetical protein [Pareuzebyella sediminis]
MKYEFEINRLSDLNTFLFMEQISIVQETKTQYDKIDQAIAIQRSHIDKLKEFKASLIGSAVRDKIKVTKV